MQGKTFNYFADKVYFSTRRIIMLKCAERMYKFIYYLKMVFARAMLKRRIIAMTVLCLSLTTLFISLLQVKRSAYPPTVKFERFCRVYAPNNSTIEFTGVQDVQIYILDSSFENAFVNYTETKILGVENPNVKVSWFDRWNGEISSPIPPYITFHTEIEGKENDTRVDFQLNFNQSTGANSQIVALAYGWGTPSTAWIELGGTDINGTYKTSRVLDLYQAYEKYYLYVLPLHQYDFSEIRKMNITYYCPPNNNVSVYTVFKILNIFDDVPSIDGAPLRDGQLITTLSKVAFPHSFRWEQLKPININMYTTYNLNASWTTSLVSPHMNYAWKVPDLADENILKAQYSIIDFDRLTYAPIVSATIRFLENGQVQILDISENIAEAFSSESSVPRVITVISNLAKEIEISIVFKYWSSPWVETTLFSSIIITIELIAYTCKYVKKVRFKTKSNSLLQTSDNEKED